MSNPLAIKSNETKFYAVLKSALDLPYVKINRDEFLERELSRRFPRETVNLAIKKSPAYAGITANQIEEIAQACIASETTRVTALSTAAGIPGGLAVLGTAPTDVAQYFGHILRVLQKLVYLYGWTDLCDSRGDYDDETLNQLTLFIGVMFGVRVASSAVAKIAGVTATKLETTIANKALTKGTIYPIVKKVAGTLGVTVNKQLFAKYVGNVVPVIGGVVSGGLTYVTFKPSAIRLKKHLEKLPTANVAAYRFGGETNFSSVILEGEFV